MCEKCDAFNQLSVRDRLPHIDKAIAHVQKMNAFMRDFLDRRGMSYAEELGEGDLQELFSATTNLLNEHSDEELHYLSFWTMHLALAANDTSKALRHFFSLRHSGVIQPR